MVESRGRHRARNLTWSGIDRPSPTRDSASVLRRHHGFLVSSSSVTSLDPPAWCKRRRQRHIRLESLVDALCPPSPGAVILLYALSFPSIRCRSDPPHSHGV